MKRQLFRYALPGLLATVGACAAPNTPAPAPAPMPGAADVAAAPTRQPPPPPMEMRPVEFPPFRETTLPNGMRLIVVQKRDQPVANVNLYVRSGGSADPVAKIGLAEMNAGLLTKGTRTRTARQIAEAIEGVGGDLSASAGMDYTTVTATTLADQLPLAMDLVSDVALRPTFPQDELENLRKRTLTGLQVALSQPGEIARRRFIREIYGPGNPYGFASLPATIQAVQRPDLVRFHEQNFRADNALMVVSGDVDPVAVEALVRQRFGAWKGGFGSRVAIPEPPASGPAQVVLVNRPGSVQSNILVGNVGIRPDNPDYYPLQVLNKIVGGGTDSRLFLILREQKGWTYGAYSSLSRPKEVGYFMASAEVRTPVTDSALVEMMTQLRRVREEPVSQQELESAKSFLVGSFPLRIETAGQIAGQVAQTELLGLPKEALLQYRERISAVTAEDVRRVAQQYVRPDQARIIVVGDAAKIAKDLERVAPVALFDLEGKPMQAADLEVRASTQVFDASRLKPMTLRYQVMAGGNAVGTVVATLARQGDAWMGTQTLQAGPATQRSEVRFGAGLAPISSKQSVAQGGNEFGTELQFANGRVTGKANLPPQMGGEKQIDAEVVRGTISEGMDQYVLAVADLQPGASFTLPVFSARSGSAVNQTFRVTGTESVTVPAGTFQTFKVEASGGEQASTIYVRQDLPHIVVKQEYAGQPISIVLQAME